MRVFEHRFQPPELSPNPGSKQIELTVADIERIGLREVLQTAGARVSSWAILESLLVPGHNAFVFQEPLGVAREVKVAASGLLGRFVARAYLERYMGLSFFAHLGTKTLSLDGHSIEIRKKVKQGDLPDWAASRSDLEELAVAEAKGCHDKDPTKRLAKAYQQTERVDVLAAGKVVSVKRIAVVTRWASQVGGAKVPVIAVQDPEEPGDAEADRHIRDAGVGLARLHAANLLEPLGFGLLATNIRAMLRRPTRQRVLFPRERMGLQEAQRALDAVRPRRLVISDDPAGDKGEGLVGSFVTRAGPLLQELSGADARRLSDLGLRPTFVGMDRDMLTAIIQGNAEMIRQVAQRERVKNPHVETTRAGTFVVEVGGVTQVTVK